MLTSWALSIPPQRSSLDPCPPWAESSFHLQIFSNLYKYEFSQKANTNTNLSSSYSCPGETRPQKVHVAVLCQWISEFWGHLTDADYGGYLIASRGQFILLNWAFDWCLGAWDSIDSVKNEVYLVIESWWPPRSGSAFLFSIGSLVIIIMIIKDKDKDKPDESDVVGAGSNWAKDCEHPTARWRLAPGWIMMMVIIII